MARRSKPSSRSTDPPELPGLAGYAAESRRPLQILLFLSPLIVVYELALLFVLRGGSGGDAASGTVTVAAHRAILRMLLEMGFPPSVVLSLGGVVLVLLLLCWHVLRRDPWRVDGTIAVGMAAESILLAIPLLAFATLLSDPQVLAAVPTLLAGEAGAAAAAAPIHAESGAGGTTVLSLGGSIAISVGAGLYEELFFRWMLIAILHTLLVDVAHLADRTGTIIAVIASAAAFTLYHDLSLPGGGTDWNRAIFLAVAGLYFGGVYAIRGFGIVVGLHAAYDIVTVIVDGPVAVHG